MTIESFFSTSLGALVFVLIILWDAAWRGTALWKSGRKNQLVWFICLFIFNTIGILPIVYLAFFQKKDKKKRR